MQASRENQRKFNDEELNIFRARLLYQMIKDKADKRHSFSKILLDAADAFYKSVDSEEDAYVLTGVIPPHIIEKREFLIELDTDVFREIIKAKHTTDISKHPYQVFLSNCMAASNKKISLRLHNDFERKLCNALDKINQHDDYQELDALLMDQAHRNFLFDIHIFPNSVDDVKSQKDIHPVNLSENKNADLFYIIDCIYLLNVTPPTNTGPPSYQ